tara:strand:- start:1011 stop:1334 length:324 start_codon:yes stop_codon:yes gene_type:complete
MSDVKLIRLTTGEELVAKITEQTPDTYLIKNPAILIPAGRDQLAFGQWLPYANIKDGLEIKKKSVVFITEPMEELYNQYSTSFGSGIVVPGKGPIVGSPPPALKLTT